MLVLTRKSNECITIGENVTVEVVRIKGNRVTIAVRAPEEVKILRGELAWDSSSSFQTAASPDEGVPHSPEKSSADCFACGAV